MTANTLIALCVTMLALVGCQSTPKVSAPVTEFVPTPVAEPDPGVPVVKIYSELTYEVKSEGWVRTRTYTVPQRISGSGFAVEVDGQRYLLTARHVCVGPEIASIRKLGKYDVSDPDNTIVRCTGRIRVGALSFVPDRISLSEDHDLAIIELPDRAWKQLDLQMYRLDQGHPKIGGATDVWGFPGTSSPQLYRGAALTDIQPDYLVLNKPLEPGYSGGPLLEAGGQFLGMVVMSTDKQSRAMRLSPALIRNQLGKAQPYSDGFTLYPLHNENIHQR